MSTPPQDNILLDPSSELNAALNSHSFGLDPTSSVLEDTCFPRTPADKEAVAAEARASKETPNRVLGRARLVLLNNEGEAVVELSQKGFTIISTTAAHPAQSTFESFDSLLIAISPTYVQTMQSELMARFAGGAPERRYHEEAEEVAWVD